MVDRFTIELDIPLDVAIQEARRRLAQHRGTISGNVDAGTFTVAGIRGAYSVDGPAVKIIITDKPGFIDASAIRAAAWEHLEEIRESYHAPAGWGD